MEEKGFFKTSDGLKLCGILSKPKQDTKKEADMADKVTVELFLKNM